MASSSSTSVRVLEYIHIKPFPDSTKSGSEFSLPITFCDAFWFNLSPVERLFFYQLNNSTTQHFNSEILPKLKHSLSLALLHYLPLAGNLKWPSTSPKPIIQYTPNDGVSLTVAESDADFDRLSSDGIYEAHELHPLMTELKTTEDSASIIALQITLFPNKGISIGIIAHHTVVDGQTSTMFMKSWAYLYKQGNTESCDLPPQLTPSFDRSIIKDQTELDLGMLYLNQWRTNDGADPDGANNKCLKISTTKQIAPDLVRATFNISPEDFKRMRERVSDSSKQLHLSNFVLTLAYLSTCIVKARGGGDDTTIWVGFTADIRQRLDPPVPENYFGNCNTIYGGSSKARDLTDAEKGFAFAANMVSNLVKVLIEKGVFDRADEKVKLILQVAKEPVGSVQLISVAGSTRLGVYGLDFGWGRPLKVDVISIDKTDAISMAESRDGSKGIEVGLALKKHEMERFSSMFLKDV